MPRVRLRPTWCRQICRKDLRLGLIPKLRRAIIVCRLLCAYESVIVEHEVTGILKREVIWIQAVVNCGRCRNV